MKVFQLQKSSLHLKLWANTRKKNCVITFRIYYFSYLLEKLKFSLPFEVIEVKGGGSNDDILTSISKILKLTEQSKALLQV